MLDPQESLGERPRAGRWSWGQNDGQPFASVVPQQPCYGLVTASHSSSKPQLRSTLVASQWRCPHCLNIVVLAVVHGLLGLLRAGLRGRATHYHPPHPPAPFPVPNKQSHFCGRKATCFITYVISREPVWPSGKAGKQKGLGSIPLRLSRLFKKVCGLWTLSCDFVPHI